MTLGVRRNDTALPYRHSAREPERLKASRQEQLPLGRVRFPAGWRLPFRTISWSSPSDRTPSPKAPVAGRGELRGIDTRPGPDVSIARRR